MCYLSLIFFFLMIRRPPRSTRTDTLFPYTTLFRSAAEDIGQTALDDLRAESLLLRLLPKRNAVLAPDEPQMRSEEHTSELQSLMRISYAVFCLKKKKNISTHKVTHYTHTPKHVTS